MAFALAPWLQPPDFLDAIRSGAQLGLQVRNADQQQVEAAARQRQAVAQLQQSWAEKVMQNQRMAEQNRITTESNDLYRTGMLDARNRGLDIQDARLNKPGNSPTISPGQGIWNSSNGQWEVPIPKTDETFTPGKPVDLGNGVQVYQSGKNQWRTVPKKSIFDEMLNTPSLPTGQIPSTNAPNPAGGTNDSVRVLRPDGRYGRIPKSQLQEALRPENGYKLAE